MNQSSDFAAFLAGKKCVIVGPSGYMHGSGLGEWIDSFDAVIRLNWGVPVPEGMEKDIGSRTDVLYKRLLKLGKLDEIDIDEYEAAGLKWIVAVDRTTDSENMRVFRDSIQDRIPYVMAGHTRATLRGELSTSPLIGIIATRHLLSFEIESLMITGCDFYASGYHEEYGGREYRQSKSRKEGTIGPTHNPKTQIRWLGDTRRRDKRLRFDATLSSIVINNQKRRLMTNSAIVIPARAKSTRFPNKPMAPIDGKPMILHVCTRLKSLGVPIFVATDSQEIYDTVEAAGFQSVLTDEALTGTDRVALAVAKDKRLQAFATIINVQGDEPLVNPESVLAVMEEKQHSGESVVGAITHLTRNPEDPTVVKVVVDEVTGRLIYASRFPISSWQQVGIYAFSRPALTKFFEYSRRTGRRWSPEAQEDVEILRFLGLGIQVRMAQVEEPGQPVDLPEHIEAVERLIKK